MRRSWRRPVGKYADPAKLCGPCQREGRGKAMTSVKDAFGRYLGVCSMHQAQEARKALAEMPSLAIEGGDHEPSN